MTGDDRSWRRLSVQRVLSVVTVALVGPVGCARAEPEDPIPFVQQLPVSQLASGYPEQPFESWLREQVGPDLEEFISWEMNDCGEGRNGMVCVAASVPANDGFSLSFNILAAGDESQVWMLYAIK
jgi:hypothetical protein